MNPSASTPDRPGKTRLQRRQAATHVFPWNGIAIVVFAGVLAMFGWFWLVRSEPVGVALLLVPLLCFLSLPILVRTGRSMAGYELTGLLVVGLLARFLGAYARFQNSVDASVYHDEGVRLAAGYRNLDFSADLGRDVPGTGAMRMISGIVHVFVNDNEFAAFLVFAWLGFWGCFLCYRARDCTSQRRSPSLRATDDVVAVARFLAIEHREGGLAPLHHRCRSARCGTRLQPAARRLSAACARLGRHDTRPPARRDAPGARIRRRVLNWTSQDASPGSLTPGSVAKVAGLILLLVAGSYLANRTQDFLELDDFSTESLELGQEEVRTETEQGGSEFDAPGPVLPDRLPRGLRHRARAPISLRSEWLGAAAHRGRGLAHPCARALVVASLQRAAAALAVSALRDVRASRSCSFSSPHSASSATSGSLPASEHRYCRSSSCSWRFLWSAPTVSPRRNGRRGARSAAALRRSVVEGAVPTTVDDPPQ